MFYEVMIYWLGTLRSHPYENKLLVLNNSMKYEEGDSDAIEF